MLYHRLEKYLKNTFYELLSFSCRQLGASIFCPQSGSFFVQTWVRRFRLRFSSTLLLPRGTCLSGFVYRILNAKRTMQPKNPASPAGFCYFKIVDISGLGYFYIDCQTISNMLLYVSTTSVLSMTTAMGSSL